MRTGDPHQPIETHDDDHPDPMRHASKEAQRDDDVNRTPEQPETTDSEGDTAEAEAHPS